MTIGGATYDSIVDYPDPETLDIHSAHGTLSYVLLEEGKKIETSSLTGSSGGGATNSATAFNRLGFEVFCVSKIGQDLFGDFILADLTKQKLDISFILRTNNTPTACSFIVPSLKGDRTVFAYRGANATINENDLPWHKIKSVNQLYITSLSGQAAQTLPAITAFAKENNVPVAINPGISQLRQGGDFIAESLQYIDMLMLNDSEAKQLMVSLMREDIGHILELDENNNHPELLTQAIRHEDLSFSILDFFRRVLPLGPKIVVVTHGSEGVYVATKGRIYFHRTPNCKVVNTLGAGDAFSSSFVAAIAKEKSIIEAIRWGIVNSSSVISYPDAKQGLLALEELEKRVNLLPKDLLQQFVF